MNKKIKKYKVGMKSETYAISMVENPAIEEDFIALAKEEENINIQLSSDEKHMVYGAVLVPEKDIYRNNGEREFYISFSKDSIEKMSQDFMKDYRQHEVTVGHEDIANEICVVESWIKTDLYKDKSVAIGLNENLPVGTWFCGMKVNNVDVWNKIKTGELKGFSVESLISLEDFSKIDNQMNIETNDMGFWAKLKSVMQEVFSAEKNESVEELASNSGLTVEEYLEETKAVAEEIAEQKVEEVITVTEPIQPLTEEESAKIEEEAKSASTASVEETNKVETPDISKLEELIGNLKNEVEALKTMNSGLEDKLKEMSKEPSVKPVKPNAKQSNGDTYTAWREQMRQMIG